MARFRNPRYAPEWLEPRLSPSGFYYSPAPEVSPPAPTPTENHEAPRPRDKNGDPIPNPTPLPEPGPELPGWTSPQMTGPAPSQLAS
jgi:hypothetical protein